MGKMTITLDNHERDLVVGDRGRKVFNEFLHANEDYPNLTGELQAGNKLKFISKSPQLQEVERKVIEHQRMIKRSVEAKVDSLYRDHESMMSSIPEHVGALSIEEFIALIENSKNVKIDSFEDIFTHIAHFEIEELLKAATNEKKDDKAERDLFSDENGLPKTPELNLPPATPAPTTVRRIIQFPSASKMVGAARNVMTPGPDIFRFGENEAPIMQSAKAPRIYKPGEVAFSIRGSPIMLPRVQDRAETFPVTDEDGKKIADVVLYAGDQDKRKEFLSIATDIRGIVASRTVRQAHRVQPSRVARKAGLASAKKPEWRS